MTEPLHNLLEQHFDTAFAAPDGIKKLRELILTLAMQGKLVAQDPNDPPASELLKQIEAEKQRLNVSLSSQKRGSSGKKDLDSRLRGNDGIRIKPLPPIKPEEVPYQLPQGWEWVRLGEVASLITKGATPTTYGFAYEASGIPFVKVENVKNNSIQFTQKMQFISEEAHEYQKRSQLQENDLLFSIAGTIGETCVVKGSDLPANINQALAIIRGYADYFCPYFLVKALNSELANNIKARARGAAMNNISLGDIKDMLLPTPPLSEQHRIVAKIDQLMAKCDELEDYVRSREEKRRAVHVAAIKQLLDTTSSFPRRRESSSSKESDLRSPSAREQAYGGDGVSAHGWNFIQQHFGELYTVKENVAELRKTILQLAVMGRLVPQDPNDPPASELLKAIEAEKQRLVKSGKIKQPKPLSPIKPEEVPYELPQGWEWVYLQDVFGIVTDGDHQAPPKSDYGIPFLVIGNLNSGQVNFDGCRYVPQDYYEALDWGRKPTRNDILYTVTGSYGISIQVEGKEQFCVQRHVAILKSLENTPVQFIRYLLRSAYALNYATTIATGIAQKTVPLMGLRRMFIALPPAIEQHRIVAKIDQLMALCDQLEQQIDAASTKQRELLDAVMSSVS